MVVRLLFGIQLVLFSLNTTAFTCLDSAVSAAYSSEQPYLLGNCPASKDVREIMSRYVETIRGKYTLTQIGHLKSCKAAQLDWIQKSRADSQKWLKDHIEFQSSGYRHDQFILNVGLDAMLSGLVVENEIMKKEKELKCTSLGLILYAIRSSNISYVLSNDLTRFDRLSNEPKSLRWAVWLTALHSDFDLPFRKKMMPVYEQLSGKNLFSEKLYKVLANR